MGTLEKKQECAKHVRKSNNSGKLILKKNIRKGNFLTNPPYEEFVSTRSRHEASKRVVDRVCKIYTFSKHYFAWLKCRKLLILV